MKITIIESPYDCGARDRRMGAGPPHLVRSGLLEDLEAAGHDVERAGLDLGPGLHPEVGAAIELARRIADATAGAVERRRLGLGELVAAIAAAGRGAPIAGVGLASYAPESDREGAGPRVAAEILRAALAGLGPSRPAS